MNSPNHTVIETHGLSKAYKNVRALQTCGLVEVRARGVFRIGMWIA